MTKLLQSESIAVPTAKALRIRQIAEEATEICWTHTPPNETYARSVAQMMCLVWAHESDGGRFNRQMRYKPNSIHGAAGEFQMEMGALRECLRRLSAWPSDARWRIGSWVFDDPTPSENWDAFIDEQTGFKLLVLSDKWAALTARMYLLTRPGAIPATVAAQAMYAKREWNTEAGKATAGDYEYRFMKYFGRAWA